MTYDSRTARLGLGMIAKNGQTRIALGCVSALLLLSPCAHAQSESTARVLVDGHMVRAEIRGSGPATVVLISGLGGGASDWRLVDTTLARFARVVSYDRAGLGASEPATGPRTVDAMTDELEGLLHGLGLKPPFVLVGHSLGGVIAEFFAVRHPAQVSALVLVDPALQAFDDAARTLPSFRPVLEAEAKQRLSMPPAVRAERDGLDSSAAKVRQLSRMPRIPIRMLIAGRHLYPPGTPLETVRRDTIEVLWRRLHIDWIAHQPNGTYLLDESSGHYIQRENPALVVQTVRAVVGNT